MNWIEYVVQNQKLKDMIVEDLKYRKQICFTAMSDTRIDERSWRIQQGRINMLDDLIGALTRKEPEDDRQPE